MLFRNITVYFKEYCSRSSVHGFQYFGENKRSVFEKIWWLIVFLICLCVCTFSIYAVYKKWEESPVIVNFANKETPIYEIPFPAVTICPESRYSQNKLNLTKIIQKKMQNFPLTEKEESSFKYISLVCKQIEWYHQDNQTFLKNISDILYEFKPDLQIIGCSFLGVEYIYCNHMITPTITDVGLCYTFNMLNRKDVYRNTVQIEPFEDQDNTFFEPIAWSLENGYSEARTSDYPQRAFLPGAAHGFTFTVSVPTQHDLDYACMDTALGYRVLLHTPLTIPRPSRSYFRVPLDQSVTVAVEPMRITTSKRVQAYSPERRKCYFSEERVLRYFKNYTASNCDLECLTNYTLKMCNCVGFYMPRENGTKICGTGMLNCMKDAELTMYQVYIDVEITKFSDEGLSTCNCLPVCADLKYHVETSQTEWNWKKSVFARSFLYNIRPDLHLSSVTVFFPSNHFITTERNELYGPLDFLASFGGLLGLFTGFSVLSLMEIFYFLSIRIFCNLRLHKQCAVPEN